MFVPSYRSAFVLLFLVMLTLTVAGVSINAYRRATRVSLDLSADILTEMSEKVINCTVGLVELSRGLLESDAVAVHEGGGLLVQRELLLALFARQLTLVPQIRSLYVADADGNLLQMFRMPYPASRVIERVLPDGRRLPSPRERIIYRTADFRPIARLMGSSREDPREQSWYRHATDSRLHISELHRFAADNSPGVTMVQAVQTADGTLHAALGADVTVAGISEILAAQRLPAGGVVVLVDAERRLVAFPPWLELAESAKDDLPRIDHLNARWLVDAYSGSIASSAREPDNGAFEHTLTETDGRRYITHRAPVPERLGTDWTLFVVVPEASLLSAAGRVFAESAVIAVIVLVAADFAVSVLAVRMFAPLEQLVHNTERISALRFDEVVRVPSRFREIRTMDAAIWRMTQGLQSLTKFVPSAIARRLVQSGTPAHPEAEVRELAVLFTGISSLVTLRGRMPPERITALLGAQLDAFTEAISHRQGTVGSYLGESILAFWGAPVAVDDSAVRACDAALACMEAETELLADWDPSDMPVPRNLFSVHLGLCIVGAIGSKAHMSYTAVGDSIAHGWDLRRLNRRYGTRIIVSGTARAQAGDRFWFRRLDRLPAGHPLAGDAELELFELVDRREHPLTTARAAYIDAYEAALTALQAEQWDTAENSFRPLAAQAPMDVAVALMLERCRLHDAWWCPGAVRQIPAAPEPAPAPTGPSPSERRSA
ncbi:adenylate/guanylate cyclase domain-containing protein [Thiocapsa bogorovii]|uniref:adenylate/guanylate cyclase domain-containing protein n=1 Tax=Thiocapsa bogorovii TaxID=521689 RepID=UPI001E60D2CC|nr:adenylate/guanylate cyclase domain-containing protein [Thiocapsa bogorovii]UHD14348.1 adenylate/guanylate cyclase domain-containing protein [Thiocapsa bogorovii]